jgi:potassium-transporting ATPase potassium-binding subunit
MSYLALTIIILIVILITKPLGTYLYKTASYKDISKGSLFNSIDNFMYKIIGVDKTKGMDWKEYSKAFLITNIIMILAVFIILMAQAFLPYNPTGAQGMGLSLAFNTAISFMTNTNLQHYAGESGITYLSQMIVIVFLMFTSAASGIATVFAIMRGIAKKREDLGNFYVDFTRIITRVLLPLSIVVTLILVSQGVPQTIGGVQIARTLQGGTQNILTGPVAVLESIKHVGTNGGGFFAANSAHPFENPTPLTNIIEILSMMIIPAALVYTFGLMVGNKKHSRVLYISLMVIFIGLTSAAIYSEAHGGKPYTNMAINNSLGNMEGKETRFGSSDSAIFAGVTTAFTTGSVNSMHDSYTPLGGGVPLTFMMLNTVFGGEGAGLENIILYAILTVFITGLMVGRTPEYLGNKIETKEIKLAALAILVHPLLILFASAITIVSGLAGAHITSPGFHGLTQMIYEFTSAAANNGSEFAGFVGNTNYMNTLTGILMFFGRYVTIIMLIAIAGSMSKKTKLEPSPGTFRTDNALFGVLFVSIIMIVGALTFFPALILGPISEFLSLV